MAERGASTADTAYYYSCGVASLLFSMNLLGSCFAFWTFAFAIDVTPHNGARKNQSRKKRE